MNADDILNSDLDDIIFERRNKDYGAYYLRKIYDTHISRAFLICLSIFLLFFGGPLLYKFLMRNNNTSVAKPTIVITKLSAPPPIEKIPPPPPPPNMPPPPKEIKFVPPVIKPDEKVTPEQEPPKQEDIQKADVTNAPAPTDENVQFEQPQTAVVEQPPPPKIFKYVEQMPTFPGGQQALMDYLAKNIRYPAAARENGIQGSVVLQFVVDETGNISSIQVLRDIGGGCADEAVRVVKAMPQWTPGKQNGAAVKVYFTLPVAFRLASDQ
jgi:periplasmic protein TonB